MRATILRLPSNSGWVQLAAICLFCSTIFFSDLLFFFLTKDIGLNTVLNANTEELLKYGRLGAHDHGGVIETDQSAVEAAHRGGAAAAAAFSAVT